MPSIEDAIHEIAESIRDGLFAIAEAVSRPPNLPQPQPFTIRLISERTENMTDFLTYEADLPAVPAGTDVASQEFTVAADGVLNAPVSLPKDATVSSPFEVKQGANVEVALVYVDDAGNRSPAKTQSFVATDTIAPQAPGDFGEIRVVSERTE